MKHIISSIALLLGSAALSPLAAKNITDWTQFSKAGVYTLNRQASAANGGGLLHASADGKTIAATPSGKGVTADSISAQWSIHYSSSEQTYFLYNLQTGTFANFNSGSKAILSDSPVDVRFTYHSTPKYWLINCGGALMGLEKENKGIALFTEDIDRAAARNLACYFTITADDNRTLSEAQIQEIRDKIAAGREVALQKYVTFLETAANLASKTNKNNAAYLGEYNTEQLQYALDHADKYTMVEIEEIYQKTLLSRYPKAGKFYRMHHQARPSTSFYKNTLRTKEDGSLWGTEFTGFAYGTATEGYSDDLCLFRFWPVNNDPTQVKIEVAAFGEFLTEVGNNARPGRTTDGPNATVYHLDTRSNTQRTFIIAQPNGDTWLTVGGSMDYVTWNKKEDSMYFYLEPVDSIEVPVDANGYASVCLPCGVKVPEGCKGYTATSVAGGKVYLEEVPVNVHQFTPWILKANPGVSSVKIPVENTTNWIRSEMAGNTRVNANTPGRYVPEYSASGITFKYVAATDPAEKSMPGSIYIVSEDNGPLQTVMGANPEAAIEEISIDEASARELFDLQGRRVINTPRAGLYINASTKRVIRVK